MYYIRLCRFTSHNYASDYFSQALKNHCEHIQLQLTLSFLRLLLEYKRDKIIIVKP